MTYYFYGIPIVSIVCITTTSPRSIEIGLLGGDLIGLPYDTYQAIRQAAGWPDVVCREG
jgi:hypothetical protein